MKYLLDADTCIHALKQQPRVIERMRGVAREDVAVSVIVEAELRLGAAKSRDPAKSRKAVEHLLGPLNVVEFTSDDAIVYADVRAALERAGMLIGPLDMLIAAQALQRGLTVVTGNDQEFRRVEGLAVENWVR